MFDSKTVFTARRHAGAVYTVVVCLSACMSVCLSQSHCSTETAKRKITQKRRTVAQGV